MRRLVTAPSGARVDTEAVLDAARAVGNHAEVHSDAGGEVTTSWFRVADSYSAPETQQLLGSMEPVRTASESFSTAAQAVARALTTFAIEAEAAEARRARAATSIASFRTVAKGDDSWQQDPVMIAQNSVLTSEVAAAERELCEAEEACARTIASIPVDAPASGSSAAPTSGRVTAGAEGWGYPDEVYNVVLNPFFFWGMKPEDVTAWWNTVPAESQAIFIASFPALIGNRNGVPARVRDEANRNLLADIRKTLEAERERLAPKNAGIDEFIEWEKGITPLDRHTVYSKNPKWDDVAGREMVVVTEKLKALGQVESVIAKKGEGGRVLLFLDFVSVNPRVAVAVGDPDQAEHIGVLVPGTSTTVAGGLSKLDGNAEDLSRRAGQLSADSESSTSIISWIYDAPQELTDATSREYARVAGPDLARLTRGLNSTNVHNGDVVGPSITVMGHSYGAVVGGDAASIVDSKIDDIVVYGAPGAGSEPVEGVGKYSMLAPDDPIQAYHAALGQFQVLGEVPYDRWVMTPPVPPASGYVDFAEGWEQLEVTGGAGTAGEWSSGSSGHSEYLKNRSRSQYNLANILIGRVDEVS